MPRRCFFFPALFALILLALTPCLGVTADATSSSVAPSDTAKSAASNSNTKGTTAKTPGKETPPKPTAKNPAKKQPRHGDAKSLSADLGKRTWFLGQSGKGKRGDVWERGVPGQSLARKRTPQGTMNTQGAIDEALQTLPSYERQPGEAQAETSKEKRPGLQGKVSTESSTWRNPVTQPVRVDQEMPVSRRNVVGAYADVIRDESLHVTVGPELSIDTEQTAGRHTTQHQSEPNTLGLGMKFQWDF